MGHATDWMLFIPNWPARGVDFAEYDKWLREVDSVNFNNCPAVEHYTNWRVVESKQGQAPFPAFDLCYIKSPGDAAKVFSDPTIAENARQWTQLWGRVPYPEFEDQSFNFQSHLAQKIAGPAEAGKLSKWLLLIPNWPRTGMILAEYEKWIREVDSKNFNNSPVVRLYTNWRIIESNQVPVPFPAFDLCYIDSPQEAEKVFTDPGIAENARQWTQLWGRVPYPELEDQSLNFQVYLAERIAGPS